MHGTDPFPGRLLLGPTEIQRLLSMDRSSFYELLADPTARFPPPAVAGSVKKTGKPRKRWHKHEVLAWILLLPRTQD